MGNRGNFACWNRPRLFSGGNVQARAGLSQGPRRVRALPGRREPVNGDGRHPGVRDDLFVMALYSVSAFLKIPELFSSIPRRFEVSLLLEAIP